MKAKKTEEDNKKVHNEYNKKWAKEHPERYADLQRKYRKTNHDYR